MFDLTKIIGNRVLVTTRRYWKYLDKVPEFAVMVSDPVTNHTEQFMIRFMDSYPKEVFNAKKYGVVALGSGRVMDFGKFIAKILDAKDLILIPGTVTTHSPWTKTYKVRNFEKKEIWDEDYQGRIILEYNPELLAHVHKEEDLPYVSQWSIPELFSHAIASWERTYIHGIHEDNGGENIDAEIDTIVEMIMTLPELGTLDWFFDIEGAFNYSNHLIKTYGTISREGTEHYIGQWEEFIGERETLHGKLISLGIDYTLKFQKKPVNYWAKDWEDIKDKFKLGVFPSWKDEKQFPYNSIIRFIDNNKLGKTVLTEASNEES